MKSGRFTSKFNSHEILTDKKRISFCHGWILKKYNKSVDFEKISNIQAKMFFQPNALWLSYCKIYINLKDGTKYKVYGNWDLETTSKLLTLLKNDFQEKINITDPECIEKRKVLSKKIKLFYISVSAFLMFFLFILLHTKLLGIENNYKKFMDSNQEVKKLWIHGTPKNLFLCPGAEGALFKTDSEDKYIYVNTCNFFTYEFYFGKKELTYKQVDRLYGIEEAKRKWRKIEENIKRYNNRINADGK